MKKSLLIMSLLFTSSLLSSCQNQISMTKEEFLTAIKKYDYISQLEKIKTINIDYQSDILNFSLTSQLDDDPYLYFNDDGQETLLYLLDNGFGVGYVNDMPKLYYDFYQTSYLIGYLSGLQFSYVTPNNYPFINDSENIINDTYSQDENNYYLSYNLKDDESKINVIIDKELGFITSYQGNNVDLKASYNQEISRLSKLDSTINSEDITIDDIKNILKLNADYDPLNFGINKLEVTIDYQESDFFAKEKFYFENNENNYYVYQEMYDSDLGQYNYYLLFRNEDETYSLFYYIPSLENINEEDREILSLEEGNQIAIDNYKMYFESFYLGSVNNIYYLDYQKIHIDNVNEDVLTLSSEYSEYNHIIEFPFEMEINLGSYMIKKLQTYEYKQGSETEFVESYLYQGLYNNQTTFNKIIL